MKHQEAVIVAAVRTPVGIGKPEKGKLSGIRPDELAALALAEVVRRAGIEPALVEDIVMGCVAQIGEQGLNIGRVAALIAGFPVEVCSVSINRMCGSSEQAVHFAAQEIISGTVDVSIGAGVESMSRVPMGSDRAGASFSEKLMARYPLVPQGLSAEMIAEKWHITREEADAFSLESHRRAAAATAEGRFKQEIMPVEVTLADGSRETMTTDQGIRASTSMEQLGNLKPAFRLEGIVTAGNSSQISDGAAAVLLMSEEKARELGLKPLARIVSMATAGVDPVMMLTGPIPATAKALKKAGLSLKDIDLVEINEAFASVPLAWAREYDPDMARVNVNGGAIALGHPLGASGARLMTTLVHELQRRGARYGLQTMCIGHGMATATIIERM
ncbi:MAG: thiolase family protein [Ktedonobacteraceae bacterium]|nr:thiolase family protein [Chloroflexota bacterium]